MIQTIPTSEENFVTSSREILLPIEAYGFPLYRIFKEPPQAWERGAELVTHMIIALNIVSLNYLGNPEVEIA